MCFRASAASETALVSGLSRSRISSLPDRMTVVRKLRTTAPLQFLEATHTCGPPTARDAMSAALTHTAYSQRTHSAQSLYWLTPGPICGGSTGRQKCAGYADSAVGDSQRRAYRASVLPCFRAFVPERKAIGLWG